MRKYAGIDIVAGNTTVETLLFADDQVVVTLEGFQLFMVYDSKSPGGICRIEVAY